MSIELETYYKLSEKQNRLVEIYNKDKEKTVFIVPSAFDKELLLDRISDGGSFLEKRPKIWMWGDFYRELTNIKNSEAKCIIDPIDHIFILKILLDRYLENAKADSINIPPGVKRTGFIKILSENIRDLLLEDILPDMLLEKIDEIKADATSPEAVLYSLYHDYYSYLSRHRLLDSAQIAGEITRLLKYSEVIEYTKKHKFVFLGFLTFAGSQLKLVKNGFDEEVERLFILPNSGMGFSHDSIKQLSFKKGYKEKLDLTINYIELAASNSFLQFNAIARELVLWRYGESKLQRLGQLNSYGDVGIQVKETQLKTLENAFSRYKIPYYTLVRKNVSETLLGELLGLIWNAYLSDWDTHETLCLLSSPLVKTADFDFRKCEGLHPVGEAKWEKSLVGQSKASEVFTNIKEFCSDISFGGTPKLVLKLWQELVMKLNVIEKLNEYLYDKPNLDDVIKDISYSIIEIERKIELLKSYEDNEITVYLMKISASEAINYIKDWQKNATLPISPPQNNVVSLYVTAPPVLTEHKYWIMTDVDYDTYPGKIKESPLLGDDKKEVLNSVASNSDPLDHNKEYQYIPKIRDKRQQKESLFRRLIATGSTGVLFTRSMTDSAARPIGKSQFLEAIKKEHASSGVIEYPLFSLLPQKEDIRISVAEVSDATKKLDRGQMPRLAILPLKKAKTISVSQLDNWTSCPFYYFCKSELRLEKSKAELYDNRRAGTFIHKLWELSWIDYDKTKTSFLKLSEEKWEEAAREYPELSNDMRLKRYRERLRKQIATVARILDDIEGKVLNRIDVEIEKFLPEFNIDGVIFRGRFDRADIYENENKRSVVLLDYKLGAADKRKNDLQLAAYSIIKGQEGYDTAGFAWIGHRGSSTYGYFDNEKLRETYTNVKPKKELKDIMSDAGIKMAEMARSVKNGVYEANYDSKMCEICDYFTICRKLEGKYYEPEDED